MAYPRYFQLARVASYQSNHRYKMGAVIVLHKPISIGFNQVKTHPRYANGEKGYSIHAEVSALLRAQGNVRGGVIYVYRQNLKGELGLAKPCESCLRELIEAGIKRVYYTTNKPPYWESMDL